MRFLKYTLLLSVLFSVTACLMQIPTTNGRPIDEDFVKSIEKGKTTVEEVVARLGRPVSVTESPAEILWTYTHWRAKPALFGSGYESQRTQTLTLRIRGGKVVDYSLSTSGTGNQ